MAFKRGNIPLITLALITVVGALIAGSIYWQFRASNRDLKNKNLNVEKKIYTTPSAELPG